MTIQETDTIRAMIRERISARFTYGHDTLARAAESARREAKIRRQWEALVDAGLVRLAIVPDECCDYDDLAGDTFDVDAHRDTVPGGERAIVAQGKAYKARIEQEGVWGIVGEYRLSVPDAGERFTVYCGACDRGEPCADHWPESADSCWGFVGTDYESSGYDLDIMGATIDALREALRDRCPMCRAPRVA